MVELNVRKDETIAAASMTTKNPLFDSQINVDVKPSY